ncbi:DUF47 family protein [bacterium]|nr:DUF47 family protein [bacterium]
MFFDRQRQIENLLKKYIDLLKESVDLFEKGVSLFISDGLSEEFQKYAKQTHKFESEMDSIRHDIAYEMYSKTILPESRGDILRILELADKIPGCMQSVMFDLSIGSINLPDYILEDFKLLLENSCIAVRNVADCFLSIFSDKNKVLKLAKETDSDESKCDSFQHRILSAIFKNSSDVGFNVLMKLFIEKVGDISNCSEKVSDQAIIISVKGQI